MTKKSFYEELLEKDGSVSIHRNIQAPATKMYKVKSGYIPKIFSDWLNQREISPYNLRRNPEFRVPLTRTELHGSESISYLGPKIRDIFPASFKEAVSLNSFKKLITTWVPQARPCRPATLLKLTLLHRCFSRFLNCTNGTKSRNAPHIFIPLAQLVFAVFLFFMTYLEAK